MIGLVDTLGNPLRSERRKPRALGRVGFQGTAYDASAWDTEETRDWGAWLASPDIENNFSRDVIVARTRDLVRNDGWASGAVTRIVDSVVGAELRLVAQPDWRALSAFAPRCDEVWAREFATAAESLWRTWNSEHDAGRWCDAARRLTVSQMFRLAFRHFIVDGEALAVLPWLPGRVGPGKARYATAVSLIDPDRLSNPHLAIDTRDRRAGVEIDEWDAPVAYWLRKAHQGDWFDAARTVTWDRYPRETEFGRPIVVHYFEPDRANEHRPAGGLLKPVIGRMKMLAKYDGVELQAAVINGIFSAYIESPYDHDQVQDALGEGDTLSAYQTLRSGFHQERAPMLGGARIPTLFPGEKIVGVDSKRPSANYPHFEGAVLRNIAAAVGLSAEQVSQDWSKTNYSSARAALLEAWRTLSRRRLDFAAGFASPIYGAFLEEAIDRGELPMPAGAPDFVEARAEYAACSWMGPPRGWIDPVKEAQAAVLRMDAGLSTLRQECAEQGLDYEEVIAQRALEVKMFRKAGLNPPVWYGDTPAHTAAEKHEPE